MKTVRKFPLQAYMLGAALLIGTSCNNNASHDDSKEQAKDINEEKFEHKEEKDADRMVEVYNGSLYEIRASENAATRANHPEVKKLASMITTAHTKMNADMQALAGRKNVTLPSDISDEMKDKLQKLVDKTGMDYDKEYTDQMKNRHDEAERILSKLSDNAEDPEIKQWAGTALTEIRAHIDMVKATQDQLDHMNDKGNHNREGNSWKDSKTDLHDGRDDIHNDNRPK